MTVKFLKHLFLTKRNIREPLCYLFSFVGAIFCLSPFIFRRSYYSAIVHDDDNGADFTATLFKKALMNRTDYAASSIATLVIVIPTLVDILIDSLLMSYRWVYFVKADNILLKPKTNEKIFRLSLIEKSVFIIGIALFSIPSFVGTELSDNHLFLLYWCTSSCAGTLITTPLAIFLERTTETWTPSRLFAYLFGINVGFPLCASSWCFLDVSLTHRVLRSFGYALLLMSTVIYFSTCGLCLLSYIRQTRRKRINVLVRIELIFDKSLNNLAPACHMFSQVLFIMIAFYFSIYPYYPAVSNCFVVVGATAVLAIEMTVQKNESYVALVRELYELFLLL